MQSGPDAEKAVTADYERLKARGTREGLELFIERHPDHPLAEKARKEIPTRFPSLREAPQGKATALPLSSS